MSAPTARVGWPSRLRSAIGPRGGLAFVVAAHLLLIIGLSHPKLEQLSRAMSDWRWNAQVIQLGINLAQASLIAAMAVLGCGRWFVRWPRGLMLIVWMAIAQIAGSWLLAENRDATLLEELLMFTGFQFLLFVLAFLPLRLLTRRRFLLPHAISLPRFQFRVIHLLVLTCEVAVLLALVRAMVPYNARWFSEVQANLVGLIRGEVFIPWGFYLVSVVAIVPAILAAAWPGPALRILLFLAVYEFAMVIVVSVLHIAGVRWIPSVWDEIPSIADLFWESMTAGIALCASAAITVWLTIWAARWLGYEFLPRPRRGGGRQSSEATSAA